MSDSSAELDKHLLRNLSESEIVTVRVFVERIMDERDRLYEAKFKAAETAVTTALSSAEKAVNAALAAQEKQTASSFAASEKAIVKAEEAQREYNIRSN
jgi:formaldehyde-activating enzyme involved in methanogenesis